jgi:hypothetical protein
VDKVEGCLYTSPETVYEFAKKIATAIAPIPLIIKVGSFASVQQMRGTFLSAERAGCAGICGLNSVSMEVVDQNGESALGKARNTSGVCGGAIRPDALQFMKEASSIKKSEKLKIALLGCGGLMTPDHLQQMLDAGAEIAMSATGMMWDPYLAMKFHGDLPPAPSKGLPPLHLKNDAFLKTLFANPFFSNKDPKDVSPLQGGRDLRRRIVFGKNGDRVPAKKDADDQ